MREDGRVYVLEADANPNLEYGEDLAEPAEAVGISYETLLQRIINLGLRYQAPWKQQVVKHGQVRKSLRIRSPLVSLEN